MKMFKDYSLKIRTEKSYIFPITDQYVMMKRNGQKQGGIVSKNNN